jgi:hypothetical protein
MWVFESYHGDVESNPFPFRLAGYFGVFQQPAMRPGALARLNSSIIARLKAGRSSGLRLDTSFLSVTTSWSHFADESSPWPPKVVFLRFL